MSLLSGFFLKVFRFRSIQVRSIYKNKWAQWQCADLSPYLDGVCVRGEGSFIKIPFLSTLECCPIALTIPDSLASQIIFMYLLVRHTLKLRHLGVLDSGYGRLSYPPYTASSSSTFLVLVGLCPICHCTEGACHFLTIKLIFNSWLK